VEFVADRVVIFCSRVVERQLLRTTIDDVICRTHRIVLKEFWNVETDGVEDDWSCEVPPLVMIHELFERVDNSHISFKSKDQRGMERSNHSNVCHGDDDGEVEQLEHRVVLQQLGQREDEECRKQINQLKRSEKKQQIMESFADPGSEKHDVEGYISNYSEKCHDSQKYTFH